jgi:parallel beta-helix repeat protein
MRRIELLLVATAVAFLCLNVNSSQAQINWANPPVHIYTPGQYMVDVDTIDCRNPGGDSKDGIDCEPAHTFLIIDGDNCLILGNSGPPYKGNALRFYSVPPFDVAKSVNVSNFLVKNMEYGVSVKGLGYSEFKNIVIDSCYRGIGSWELTEYTVGLKILDNKILNTTDEGMKIYKMTDCEISGNIITAAGRNGGIRCHNQVNYSQIKNNIITDCKSEGLYLRHSSYNSIEGNVLKGNTTGIRIDHEDGYFNTLTGDSIVGGTSMGLYFNGADSNSVVNMVIDGDGTLGIGIRATGGAVANVIKDSKIFNVAGNDIQVEKDCILDLINTSFDSAKVDIQDNGILNVGYRVTVVAQVDGAPVAGTVEIKNAAGDKVYTGASGEALAVVTYTMTAGGALAEGPFEVTASFNDGTKDYKGTLDALEVAADMTVTLDLERDVSEALIVLRESGTYTFPDTIDVAGDSVNVMKIFSDDVTIDGAGTGVLIGEGPGPDYQGIWPRTVGNPGPHDPGRLNVTVKNIRIESLRTGVYYRGASGTIDNLIIDNCDKGINVNSRQAPILTGAVISNNTVTNSDRMAIEARCGPDAQVLNNTIIADRALTSSGVGIGVELGWPIAEGGYATTNGLYKGNTITGGGFLKIGFQLDRSIENTFEDNTITGCTDYGINILGSPTVTAKGNVFTNTAITGPSGVGVGFRWASGNVFDSLTVDGADVAIQVEQGSKDNVIMNSSVTNSATYDVVVKQNSNLFLINPLVALIDPNKISVEKGSAIFLGNSLTDKFNVEVTATYLGFYPLPDMDVYVQNAQGDTLNSYVTDADGKVSLSLAVKGITASGYWEDQNPFTITVSKEVDGIASLLGSVTESITGDVSLTVIVIDPKKTDVASQHPEVPTEFALSQNYPNPFNPDTEIAYQLPKAGDVAINVYNVYGQLIATLVDEHQSAGYKSIVWNGRDRFGNAVSSGLYFYSLEAGDFKAVKRMMLLK